MQTTSLSLAYSRREGVCNIDAPQHPTDAPILLKYKHLMRIEQRVFRTDAFIASVTVACPVILYFWWKRASMCRLEYLDVALQARHVDYVTAIDARRVEQP